jgi:hypothetical protein
VGALKIRSVHSIRPSEGVCGISKSFPRRPYPPSISSISIGSARFVSTQFRVAYAIFLGHQVRVPERRCRRDCDVALDSLGNAHAYPS